MTVTWTWNLLRARGAPYFDSRYPEELYGFLEDFEDFADCYALQPWQMARLVVHCADDNTSKFWQCLDGYYDSTPNYGVLRKSIISSFSHRALQGIKFKVAHLEEFQEKTMDSDIRCREDLEKHYRRFWRRAEDLLERDRIDDDDCDHYFWMSLPSRVRKSIRRHLDIPRSCTPTLKKIRVAGRHVLPSKHDPDSDSDSNSDSDVHVDYKRSGNKEIDISLGTPVEDADEESESVVELSDLEKEEREEMMSEGVISEMETLSDETMVDDEEWRDDVRCEMEVWEEKVTVAETGEHTEMMNVEETRDLKEHQETDAKTNTRDENEKNEKQADDDVKMLCSNETVFPPLPYDEAVATPSLPCDRSLPDYYFIPRMNIFTYQEVLSRISLDATEKTFGERGQFISELRMRCRGLERRIERFVLWIWDIGWVFCLFSFLRMSDFSFWTCIFS